MSASHSQQPDLRQIESDCAFGRRQQSKFIINAVLSLFARLRRPLENAQGKKLQDFDPRTALPRQH